jgi:phosphatidylinositol kinase/protein kinase (PI-3  family)
MIATTYSSVDFTADYQLANPDPVPFRLTRNLEGLLGPAYLDGVFTPLLHASTMCYAKYQVHSFGLLFLTLF